MGPKRLHLLGDKVSARTALGGSKTAKPMDFAAIFAETLASETEGLGWEESKEVQMSIRGDNGGGDVSKAKNNHIVISRLL